MHKIVVSDTTAIIVLSKIRALDLLKSIYGEIVIPEAVFAELTYRGRAQPGALQVINADWIKIESVKDRSVVEKLRAGLDLGESEAIALSLEKNAHVLIMDEVAGRAAAKANGQKVIGMVGILLLAKKSGLIREVRPYLDELHSAGFHLGPAVRQLALKQAGEAGEQKKA